MLKRHRKKSIVLAILGIAALFFFWPGIQIEKATPISEPILVENFGVKETAIANIVGLEPFIQTSDFASAQHLQIKLSSYLEVARENGLLRDGTIVLLPSHIGTGLLVAGQKSRTYDASSLRGALIPVISRNLIEFTKNYFVFDAPDNHFAAAVRTQTALAAQATSQVFSALAKKYQVTLVTGSGLLMTPGLYPDGLTYGHGPIFHAGFVFGPDGIPLVDAVRQVVPTETEQLVAKTSLAEYLPVFDLNGLRFAVALGADAANEEVTAYLNNQRATLLLSPQFHVKNDPVTGAFGARPLFRWAMAVSMKGKGWGLEAEGRSTLIVDGEPIQIQNGDTTGRIYNIWIGK